MSTRSNNSYNDKFVLENHTIEQVSSQWEKTTDQVPFFVSTPIFLRGRVKPTIVTIGGDPTSIANQ